ncbi:MAG: transporter substrate-binding domain-containing protein [Methylophilaceae bacterium]
MSDISARNHPSASNRTFAILTVLPAAAIIASLIIGIQYYSNRNAAIKTALSSYQLAAKDVDDFIDIREQRAKQLAETLSKYTDLKVDNRASAKITELFANAMLSNPAFYNIYLGFSNGDFYEVISLDNNPAMREYLKAQDKDHWVVNRIYPLNGKRVKQLYFLDNHLQIRTSRYDPSNYDARSRPWFNDAHTDTINKTSPYIFSFPQIPGQTYSIKLPDEDTVLGIDTPLEALANYLNKQPLSSQGEVYLYKASGEILASNRNKSEGDEQVLAPIKPMKLPDSQRQYIDSLGSVKISNEQDWPPLDFSVAGDPQGYTVDLLKLAAAKLGLQIEFINGYSWTGLMEKFEQDKVDILQPIAETNKNSTNGYLSAPIANLPIGLAFRDGEDTPASLAEMKGKIIAIPKGWASIQALHTSYPDIKILEVSSSKAALEAVRDGNADATMDASVILHFMANRYFIEGLSYVEMVDTGNANIPKNFHFLVTNRLRELGPLLEMAIKNIEPEYKDHLRHKWLSTLDTTISKKIMTVPYPELINTTSHEQSLNTARLFSNNGDAYLSYVYQLDRGNKNSDYFGVVVPAKNVLGSAMDTLRSSILLMLGVLILLLILTVVFANPIASVARKTFAFK